MTVEQFGKALVASGLMTADDVKSFWNGIAADARPKTAADFGKLLVEKSLLTPFQVAEIIAGRGARLVMGDYTIAAQIGAGGMGQVYKANHRRMKRTVALKVMSNAAMQDEAAVKRFQREVHAAAKLEHPNIVTAYDSGESGNVKYLVMQFVDGGDLSDLVKKGGRLQVEQAVGYVIQAARGLAFAHGEGVIHRDIKPANLLLDKKGVVKILDMGLARFEDGGDGLTATEQVMGTVDYMSPEQAANTKGCDGRADIYSLGCTLWFLLTGKKLYEADTLIARLMLHRDGPLPSLVKERDDAPWPLEQALHKMIAKRPQDRYQTMDEVVAALAPFAGSAAAGSGAGSSSSISQNADLASFMQAMGTGGGTKTNISATQVKPATSTNVDATAQFTSPEVGTDPKSQVLPKSALTAKPQAAKKGAKPGNNRTKLIAAGGALVGLLLLAGIIVKIRDKDGNVVAEVNAPTGTNVEVITQPQPVAPVKSTLLISQLYESPDYVWTKPENLGPTVNGPKDDYRPCLTSDRNRIYFVRGDQGRWEATRASTSAPFGPPVRSFGAAEDWMSGDGLSIIEPAGGQAPNTFRQLKMIRRATTDSAWDSSTAANPFAKTTTPDDKREPTMSPDGLTVVYVGSDAQGRLDLWMTSRPSLTVPFDAPVKFGPHVNTGAVEGFGMLLGDNQTLVFLRESKWHFTLKNSAGIGLSMPLADIPLEGSERNVWFSPDGREVYFSANLPGGFGGMDMYVSRLVPRNSLADPLSVAALLQSPDYIWTTPENLGPPVNGPGDQNLASVTTDQTRIYFSRKGSDGKTDELCEAVRPSLSTPFGKPVVIAGSAAEATVSHEGTEMVRGYPDLHWLRRPTLDVPFEASSRIQSETGSIVEKSPTLSPDGLALVFNSARDQATEKTNLYVRRRQALGQPFGPATKLPPVVNSPDYEQKGFMLADGQSIVFLREGWYISSTRSDGTPITVPLPSHPFGATRNLWIARDGRTAYFSADLPGGLGDKDIYVTRRVPKSGAAPTSPSFVATVTPTPAAMPIAADWSGKVHGFGGHSYQLINSFGTWTEAKQKAETLGGHLATINSLAERDFILNNIWRNRPPLDERAGRMYLGGVWTGGAWTWITGEPLDRSLMLGNPVVSNNATALAWHTDAEWIAVDPNDPQSRYRYFLVEWDTPSAATPSSATPAQTPPPAGDYALHISRDNSVTAPNPQLDESQPFTVEAYITPGDAAATNLISHRVFGVHDEFHVEFKDSRWRFYSTHNDATSPDKFTPRRRVHLAGVRTATARLLFIDGKLIAAKDDPLKLNKKENDFPLRIEMLGPFDVTVDELRISQGIVYDKEFTPPAKLTADANTVALYHFDEGFGDVVKDSSGKGRDGKIVGATWVKADGSPIPAVPASTAPASNGVVYLDDLPETELKVFNFGKHGLDTWGKPIDWRGRQPAHSLYMHPLTDNSLSTVTYSLDGKFATLNATVGLLNTPRKAEATLTFRVLGDGRELWKSSPIQLATDEAVCSISVASVRELRLEFICKGGTYNVNGAWIEPRLTPVASPVIPAEALTFGGHRYLLVDTGAGKKLRWSEAKDRSEAMGGHLATINTREEFDWLQKSFRNVPSANDIERGSYRLWLGGSTDAQNPNQWIWVTGEPFDRSLWSGSGPDGAKLATAMGLSWYGVQWDDAPPGVFAQYFLVEWDTPGTTIASATMPAGPISHPTGALPPATATAAVRWPLAPTKPEEIAWLKSIQARLTLRNGTAGDRNSPFTETTAPPGDWTVVGIELQRDTSQAIDDTAFGRICGLIDLESFTCDFAMPGARVTKQGFEQLKRLTNLRHLQFGRLSPPDSDPAVLAAFPNLESLGLTNSPLIGWEPYVAKMASLGELTLYNVNEADLKQLGAMPRLTKLRFAGYQNHHPIRQAAAQPFIAANPWCRVTFVGLDGDNMKQLIIEPTAPPAAATSDAPTGNAMLAPGAIDLLPHVRIDQPIGGGVWTRSNDGVAIPDQQYARTVVDYEVPDEYELIVEVMPQTGNHSLVVGLSRAGKRFWIPVSGWRSATTKIEPDTNVGSGQTKSTALRLVPGKLERLTFTVRRDGVKLVDGSTVLIDWKGDTTQIPEWEPWKVPEPSKPAFGSWAGTMLVRRLELRPLTAAKPTAGSGTDDVTTVAKWLLDNKKLARIGFEIDGKRVGLSTLPTGPFKVVDLNFSKFNNSGQPLSEAEVARLAVFTDLESLELLAPELTDAGFARLAPLTKLKVLIVADTPLTPASVATIRRFPQLEKLHGFTSDEWLKSLAGMPTLRSMTLWKDNVSPQAMGWFPQYPNLNELRLHDCFETPDVRLSLALAPLKDCKSLTKLYLNSAKIDADALAVLSGLTGLIELDLSQSHVSEAQLKQLTAALPRCRIRWKDPANNFKQHIFEPTAPPATAAGALPTTAIEQWIKETSTKPAAEQLEAVSKKLIELNPGFDGKLAGRRATEPPTVENGIVTILKINGPTITDLSPLRALTGLVELDFGGPSAAKGKFTDLSSLRGMQLKSLILSGMGAEITDLMPLAGMPLEYLSCRELRKLTDLGPIAGMSKLKHLDFLYTDVADLAKVQGLQELEVLVLPKSITDISPLKSLKLKHLECNQITSLEPLRGMPLRSLWFSGESLTDFSPLYELKDLEHVRMINAKLPEGFQASLQKALPNCRIDLK